MTIENTHASIIREDQILQEVTLVEDRYIVEEAYIAREYEIPTSRVGLMEDKLAKLNRKADKLGCPRGIAEVISEPFIKELYLNESLRPKKVEFVRVSVTGEAPKLEGWSFLGYIDKDKLVYGEHITDEERDRQGECDYCHQSRPRTHTYVVSHEGGERKVVGSTCMQDFLGGLDPKSMVSWLTVFRNFVASFTDEGYRDDGSSETHDLSETLGLTWKVMRVHGWMSGSEAWNSQGVSTSQRVRDLIDAPASSESSVSFRDAWVATKEANNLPDSDPQLIVDAIEWAKSHKDSDNNYLNNIGIIAENGYTTKRSMGMAVSILSSYEREVEKRIKAEARRKASEESNHVGEIGKREVFDNVQLTGVQYLESMFGTSVLHRFLMDDTNQVVWFGSKELDVTVGDTFSIKATVKKHGEFNSIPQTTINRVVKV